MEINLNTNIIPKRDIVFKKLFGSKGNENILKDFLEAVLNIEINNLKLDLNKEFIPENLEGKRSLLDVRAELTDGTEVNIEMQMKNSPFLEDRAIKFAVNMINNTLMKGDPYQNLPKTICIWILNENHFHENKKYHTRWTFKEDEAEKFNHHLKKIEFHFIELNKLRKADIIKPSKLDYWLWFIDYTNKEKIMMAYKNEKEVKEALDKLRELSSDRALVDLMNSQDMYERDQISMQLYIKEEAQKEGMAKGLAEGIAKGLAEGKAKGLAEGKAAGRAEGKAEGRAEGIKEAHILMAKKLKKLGMSDDKISEITELSKEELESLVI